MFVACRWPSSSRLMMPCRRVQQVTPRRSVAGGRAGPVERRCQASSWVAKTGLTARPVDSGLEGRLPSAARNTFMVRCEALTISSEASRPESSEVEKTNR